MKKVNTYNSLGVSALALAALLSSTAAQATSVPAAQTTTADPGRVSERLRESDLMPQVMPEIEIKELKMRGAPEGAENIKFTLSHLSLDGVTVYDDAEILSVYESRLGQTITLADLYGIAGDLTRKYRNDGYVLTQVVVPPQTIEAGTARLKVVEGYIDSINVRGEETEEITYEDDLVLAYANKIRSDGRALNVRELERTLLLINDLPGVQARSILSPSTARTGAADLTILVTRDKYDGLLAIDNHGSRFLGPVQITAAGSMNSVVFDKNERITAQVAIAPDPGDGMDFELAYYSLEYTQPVWDNGTTLSALVSYTHTEPGFTLKQFNVKGQSVFARLGLSHPVYRSRAFNIYSRASFDIRDVESKNDLEPTRDDKIRAFRLGSSLEFLESGWLGTAVNTIDLELSKGVDIFAASNEGRDNLSRPFGDPSFFKLEAALQRLQRVTSEINLLMAVNGQWANDALLSSEEFGVGGIALGRAFDPSEIVGDQGISGKLEVQWNKPYDWSLVQDYQVFGFYDAGRIWNEDSTSADLERETITSAGFGLRTEFMEDTAADFTVAFPLNRDVATQQDKDPRFYFSLSRRF
jgi:hemolysin activation/secretion protein